MTSASSKARSFPNRSETAEPLQLSTSGMCTSVSMSWPAIKGVMLCSAALLLLFCGVSQGQDSADLTGRSLQDLMNIKVYSASRYSQFVSEAPASVTVISRDQIERGGYRRWRTFCVACVVSTSLTTGSTAISACADFQTPAITIPAFCIRKASISIK